MACDIRSASEKIAHFPQKFKHAPNLTIKSNVQALILEDIQDGFSTQDIKGWEVFLGRFISLYLKSGVSKLWHWAQIWPMVKFSLAHRN